MTRVKVIKQSTERSDIFQLCFAVEHNIGICIINKFRKSMMALLKLLLFYMKCFQDSGTFCEHRRKVHEYIFDEKGTITTRWINLCFISLHFFGDLF